MHPQEDPSSETVESKRKKKNKKREKQEGRGNAEKREVAFFEYLYTACVTTIVSPSAFIETSLCTLYVVSPLL